MKFKTLIIMVLATASAGAALADSKALIPEIIFAHHRFAPQNLAVAAGRPLKVKVTNSSKETIEFESFSLNRETVVEPGQSIIVRLPALRAGTYDFYDDFHEDVPEGSIVAK